MQSEKAKPVVVDQMGQGLQLTQINSQLLRTSTNPPVTTNTTEPHSDSLFFGIWYCVCE